MKILSECPTLLMFVQPFS